jgi:hypothetical protein
MIEHPLVRHILTALAMTGALLVIPASVAAEDKKEPHALYSVSPALQGLLIPARPAGQAPRPAPPAATRGQGGRAHAMPHAFRKLPHHQLGAVRQEASLLRRMTLARLAPLSHYEHPQKPLVLQGQQIRTVDGDTFAYGGERFRIRGYDAPETTEPGGFAATQRLDSLLHEGPVLVIPYGADTYGRTLAEVFVNNRDVAEVMKEEGHDKRR